MSKAGQAPARDVFFGWQKEAPVRGKRPSGWRHIKVDQYFPCGFLNTVTVNVKTGYTLRDRLCFIQTANQEKFRVFSLCPESLLRYIFGKLTAPHKNKDIVGCL